MLYLQYIINSFKETLAYRFEYFIGLINHILSMLAWVYIWKALLGHTGETSSSIGIISLQDMVTYAVVSRMINSLTTSDVITRIEEKVKSGQISTDLIKPVNFRGLMFADMTGFGLYRIIFELPPMLLIGIFCFGIKYPAPENLLLFFIMLINGTILNFTITYGLGLSAFWIYNVWHYERFNSDMTILFSGSWIPLWFYPDFLAKLSEFLPFRLIFYVPISAYLGKINQNEGLFLGLQQILWIIGLHILTSIVWNRATRKLQIQGG
jgi:ABC-2 type transport system permease protein